MKRHTRKEFSFPALLLMGSGFALATVLAVAMLLAVVAYLSNDPTSLTAAFALLTLVLAGAVSGFVTSRVNGDGGALIGILSALICTAIIAVVGLIVKGGLIPLGAILNLAVYAVTSVAAATLAKRKKTARRRRY